MMPAQLFPQPQQPAGGPMGMGEQQQRVMNQQQQFAAPQQAQMLASNFAAISANSGGAQPLKALLPAVPPQCGPPTVSLALLLDFAIHQTLHELQILSELNLKKKPEDRKISVVQFAHSTRLIFVRLLAIVRWLKTYKKFEPLTSIRYLLDEQAARYVETADKLVEIARNELPNARLPVFQVVQAVDVLTLGTYARLPQNIKDRFISTSPLSGRELRLTLRRLNRVFEFRLAQSARQISPRVEQITVRNGIATLLVPNEFEMALTLLGDEPQTKWCLLNIRILVENAEVGQGQRLVHPLQVNFLHQIVQEKLDHSEKPLTDAYSILHWFCRSLQLDVLYCQALQIGKMSPNYIRVEEYDVKECRLTISYWLVKDAKNRLTSQHRLIIYGDKSDPNSTLNTKHRPANPELPKMDKSFSLQRLLNETVFFRCRERLLLAKGTLEQAQPKTGVTIGHSGHCLLSLSCPLMVVDESHPDECLVVAVNTFFGSLQCRVEILGSRDEIRDLEQQLNSSSPSIPTISRLLDRLRILILMERLQRALVGLQVRPLSETQTLPLLNKLGSLTPSDRRVFQFIREDQFYLVVTFEPDDQVGVKIQFHLFSATEGRLTMLDLDADEIIRSAPMPRIYATSVQRSQNAEFSEFFERFQRRKPKAAANNATTSTN